VPARVVQSQAAHLPVPGDPPAPAAAKAAARPVTGQVVLTLRALQARAPAIRELTPAVVPQAHMRSQSVHLHRTLDHPTLGRTQARALAPSNRTSEADVRVPNMRTESIRRLLAQLIPGSLQRPVQVQGWPRSRAKIGCRNQFDFTTRAETWTRLCGRGDSTLNSANLAWSRPRKRIARGWLRWANQTRPSQRRNRAGLLEPFLASRTGTVNPLARNHARGSTANQCHPLLVRIRRLLRLPSSGAVPDFAGDILSAAIAEEIALNRDADLKK